MCNKNELENLRGLRYTFKVQAAYFNMWIFMYQKEKKHTNPSDLPANTGRHIPEPIPPERLNNLPGRKMGEMGGITGTPSMPAKKIK
jgi:hypothetical protein